jgi:DNA-binding MarR family transcriptional regulator
LGSKQRQVVERLAGSPWEDGLPLQALRPALGRDRSNARRVIRSLIGRGDVEVIRDPETGGARLRLEFWCHVSAVLRRARYLDDPEPVEGTPW